MPQKKYLELHRFDGAERIEEILKRHIEEWRNQPSPLFVDRIFPLFGNPGVGKTSLLERLADTQKGVLIDLATRQNHDTHVAFINSCRQKIESEHTYKGMKKLFLVDHVPGSNDDVYLDEFQKKIFLPYLEQGSFFVMSQQDTEWYWDSSLPHTPPYILRGFSASHIGAVIKSLANGKIPESDLEKRVFSVEEIYPLLVQKWGDLDNGDICSACNEFLAHWIEQVDPIPPEEQKRELKIAGAMSWLDSVINSGNVEKIAGMIGEEVDFVKLREMLGSHRWTAAFGKWEEPSRTILNVWFRCAEPGLAEKLDAQFGGNHEIKK